MNVKTLLHGINPYCFTIYCDEDYYYYYWGTYNTHICIYDYMKLMVN